MNYLLSWLKELLRFRNIPAITGSLKRRIFGLNFLEMRINLEDKALIQPVLGAARSLRYAEHLEEGCVNLLNSVGTLGFWRPSRFRKELLSSVENAGSDIFLLCINEVVVGFAVLHKKSQGNLNEIGYVAVRPEYRRAGLGYNLIMHILAEMKARNICGAYLRTDTFRIPAIKTYLKCGFYPYVKNDNEKKRWHNVMNKLEIKSGKKYGSPETERNS